MRPIDPPLPISTLESPPSPGPPPSGSPRSTHLNLPTLNLQRQKRLNVAPQNHLRDSGFCFSGSGALGADMGGKFSIALLQVVPHHFIEGVANGWSRKIAYPCAFGAAPAQEVFFLDPYQFAAHTPPATERKITSGNGLLSVGYPTRAGMVIAIRGHPRTVE
jgi:hypothetical protein